MPLSRKQKDAVVSTVGERLEDASLVVLTGFSGISVEADTKLREDIRKTGAYYRVIKNTLAKRVLAGDEYAGLYPQMKGMTGYVLGGEDPVATAKALTGFAKGNKKVFQVKGGYFEGRIMSAEDIEALAKTPSREELLTRLASALNSPIQKLASVLSAPIQKLAGTLQALADKQDGGDAA